jgi:hypothetical protein
VDKYRTVFSGCPDQSRVLLQSSITFLPLRGSRSSVGRGTSAVEGLMRSVQGVVSSVEWLVSGVEGVISSVGKGVSSVEG